MIKGWLSHSALEALPQQVANLTTAVKSLSASMISLTTNINKKFAQIMTVSMCACEMHESRKRLKLTKS